MLKSILTNSNGSPTEADLKKMENVIQDFQQDKSKLEDVTVNNTKREIIIKYRQDAFDPEIEHIYSVKAPQHDFDTGDILFEVILFEGREDHEFNSKLILDDKSGEYFDRGGKCLDDLETAISNKNICHSTQVDTGPAPELGGLRCGSDRGAYRDKAAYRDDDDSNTIPKSDGSGTGGYSSGEYDSEDDDMV